MYSYEDRIKAVKLYIKYDQCSADTIRELGLVDKNTLSKSVEKWRLGYQTDWALNTIAVETWLRQQA